MGKTRLIINGDDFGVSEAVNQAVVRAYREGVLTSCSLMVSGDCFESAVRLARENEGLAVGIHLVCVMGRSVLHPSEIPAIVDRNGFFASDPAMAGLNYFFSKRARGDLARELEAQFAKFAGTGLRLSHIDSHLHMHVHPVVFRHAVGLGERYGARGMRVPHDELLPALKMDPRGACARSLQAPIFRILVGRMKRELRKRHFLFCDRVYGHFMSGRMSEDYVLHVLDHLHYRTNEIYFHPALTRGDLQADSGQQRGFEELEVILGGRMARSIRAKGVCLTNYFGLEDSP